MFNQNQYYRNYRYNSYYGYNNFIPTYYPNKDYNIYDNNDENNTISDNFNLSDTSQVVETTYDIEDLKEDDFKEEKKEEETKIKFDSSSKKQFRLGPLSVCDNSINILGFSIAIDDLIIIGLIILLLFQSETDYIIIIILGLILLNIDFSSLGLF